MIALVALAALGQAGVVALALMVWAVVVER